MFVSANFLMYLIALVLVTVASVQARTFNNPIVSGKSQYFPGAIKVKETYYVVTSSPNTNGLFPIFTSQDLNNWAAAGLVFDATNTPTWPRSDTFTYPEIHQIGNNFVVYFSGYNTSYNNDAIGAAIAPHPLGPYTPIHKPIMTLTNNSASFPNIINDEGKIYLVWSEGDEAIYARQLNSDGVSLSSDQTTTLLKPSLKWEGGYIYSPWYIRRGSYHYLFYTGNLSNSGSSVGVARSSNALGPYEKLPNPILVANSKYECTGDVSVVKDLDNKDHLIFFNGIRRDDDNHRPTVLLASILWNADDWPYVEGF